MITLGWSQMPGKSDKGKYFSLLPFFIAFDLRRPLQNKYCVQSFVGAMFEWHFPILNLFSFDCPHVLSYGENHIIIYLSTSHSIHCHFNNRPFNFSSTYFQSKSFFCFQLASAICLPFSHRQMADIISQKREKGAKKKVPEENSFYHSLLVISFISISQTKLLFQNKRLCDFHANS